MFSETQKSLLPTFWSVLTTQYSFRILYLPTEILMVIVYQKKFLSQFLKNFNVQMYIRLVSMKDKNMYSKAKITQTQHDCPALNAYLSSF